MNETVIAGTELKLTVRMETDGVISVEWDHHAGRKYLFHDGWAVLLRRSQEYGDDVVEMVRTNVESVDLELVGGHIEPLLS
jgi:hypothetical protein